MQAKRGGLHMRFKGGIGVLLLLALTMVTALWSGIATANELSARIEDSKSRYTLGQMYEEAGDLTRAEQYYQQAVELWPENQEARIALQRLIDARKPPEPPKSFWKDWFTRTGTGAGIIGSFLEGLGWLVMILLFVAVFFKLGMETIRLAIMRSKGIPLLGMGTFKDPTGRVPGLPHQLANQMNKAGLTIYDEKGAVVPDFNFIGESGFAQARLVAKMLEIVHSRQVQRINVEVSQDAGMLSASVSLVDSANGYVRYLQVVAIDPRRFDETRELTRAMAQQVASTILISLSRDPNTRGLLFQRMGDWPNALKEFINAAETARKQGRCGTYYQAHLNLGNLYSFLGLQDKSVAAYHEVAEQSQNPVTLALIHAAIACSYKNWEAHAEPDQKATYEWLARQAIEKTLVSPHKTPLIAYTIACYYSLSDQMDEVIRWLREAVAGDLGFLEYVMNDPDMENYRRFLNGRPPGEPLGIRF